MSDAIRNAYFLSISSILVSEYNCEKVLYLPFLNRLTDFVVFIAKGYCNDCVKIVRWYLQSMWKAFKHEMNHLTSQLYPVQKFHQGMATQMKKIQNSKVGSTGINIRIIFPSLKQDSYSDML
mmetsp:Transcript_7149/g.8139  ORF Transcript_7149/g.8139 Transcript_7149/m.8139 type:complete len:122 (-) Transcript_7149:694-1059(-)